ncbi:uncharacterized protein Bfra_009555 [Botrytis fragariae]|uniref:Uncharacterized protein n=1 Tax=Botrytis fragariae TaxID=1964551 RepID=A0A8H6AP17_9HELO|nr:uncharacterized protein Bfra_009555 [Botrytis fragariae]KAF5870999.1 hypothetical protein Bfra_009555 [Botrytis fragariae]
MGSEISCYNSWYWTLLLGWEDSDPSGAFDSPNRASYQRSSAMLPIISEVVSNRCCRYNRRQESVRPGRHKAIVGVANIEAEGKRSAILPVLDANLPKSELRT